jgi:hypothetical protein
MMTERNDETEQSKTGDPDADPGMKTAGAQQPDQAEGDDPTESD